LKAIGIANAVKEQVNQNKENQRILAQATVEGIDKIEQLEKQQAQLYAALMAKQPLPISPLQDTTAATIKALTDKINPLENGGNFRRRTQTVQKSRRAKLSIQWKRWNQNNHEMGQ
jgi:hypothetical protein